MPAPGAWCLLLAIAASALAVPRAEQAIEDASVLLQVKDPTEKKPMKVGDIVYLGIHEVEITWDGRPKHDWVRLRWTQHMKKDMDVYPINRLSWEPNMTAEKDVPNSNIFGFR
uniref:Uncharacterized protein n=1 Tax=Alexandrium catenella TaxID=2925 RepID=A0A7S1WEZ8_ALECA|mmetsp:Transcript_5505/g.14635  ORF Transcript_5505/g.14635 Transcript_5505/m.14635 type:complete len:113 (+) Transcript_5505:111-449(+)|eukprot:CAMPEP_0171217310 /NCGR_PEP_ID=MMETSP0790-20130122/32621_1 /TAXON_ID=2925 /ORGANISM="Alexandrium catenella, Strain OF101" /LENGTH=112 /DNA_ID=CAMNT_0011683099 /DNA_START=105 /DNA_END=443 /DNA_ORIENTATION=-